MKTVGQILKNARVSKKYSIRKLSELTKIKSSFISAIEKQKWEDLPPFPTVLGFVKSVSTTLEIDEKAAVAILKRDYPPKNEPINPKPDISSRFTWSPKLTFAVGVGIVLIVILGYLVFQYAKFISPPSLRINSPKEGETFISRLVAVSGTTESDAKVMANNQPILVDQDGKFNASLEVNADTKEIVIKSISRSGKETTVKRTISVR